MIKPRVRPTAYDAIPGRATIQLTADLVLANTLNLALPVVMLNGTAVASDVLDLRGFSRFWIRWAASGANVRLLVQIVDPIDQVTVIDTLDPVATTGGAGNDARLLYDPAVLSTVQVSALFAPLDLIKLQWNNNSGGNRNLTAIGTMILQS